MEAEGDDRMPPPLSLMDFHRYEYDPAIVIEAELMTTELFGLGPSEDFRAVPSRKPLYHVERLSARESDIAGRTDLSHTAKIEAIRPLRAKREAREMRSHGSERKPDEGQTAPVAFRPFEQLLSP
jgi:hypothetical protein